VEKEPTNIFFPRAALNVRQSRMRLGSHSLVTSSKKWELFNVLEYLVWVWSYVCTNSLLPHYYSQCPCERVKEIIWILVISISSTIKCAQHLDTQLQFVCIDSLTTEAQWEPRVPSALALKRTLHFVHRMYVHVSYGHQINSDCLLPYTAMR
jgi:hypothetical protein